MYLQATLQGCGQLPLKHIQQPLASNSPVRQHSISLDILQANSPSAILKTTYKFLSVSKIDNHKGPTIQHKELRSTLYNTLQ